MGNNEGKRYCAICGKDMKLVVNGIVTESIGMQATVGFEGANSELMNNPVGECGRYPPHKTKAKGDWWNRCVKAREWPVTEANDWCGEGIERGES